MWRGGKKRVVPRVSFSATGKFAFRAGCARVRNPPHPINEEGEGGREGSRDLSMDKVLSTRLHRLRDERKPCREENAREGNLKKRKAKGTTKGDNRGMREFQLENDFKFRILAVRDLPRGEIEKQPYRFRRTFDSVFTRNAKYPRGERKELGGGGRSGNISRVKVWEILLKIMAILI